MEKKYRILEHLEKLHSAPGDKEKALADAMRIAAYLKETYHAEVIGVGSLFLDYRPFTGKSDIDIVVKGLPENKFFSISARVSNMTEFEIDIIPYEDANELMRSIADEEGVRL